MGCVMKYKLKRIRIVLGTLLRRKGWFRDIYFLIRRFVKGSIFKSYFDETKSVFIHIPKAAGKSVALSLYQDDKPGHFMARDYLQCDKNKFDGYFIFSIVRDPYMRLQSAYNFLTNGGATKEDAFVGEILRRETSSFNDFVLNWLDEERMYFWHHFVPQSDFLTIDGALAVDYLGRFENLMDDFAVIAARVNPEATLKKINVGGKVSEEKKEKDVSDKLKALYSEDYSLLGYQ